MSTENPENNPPLFGRMCAPIHQNLVLIFKIMLNCLIFSFDYSIISTNTAQGVRNMSELLNIENKPLHLEDAKDEKIIYSFCYALSSADRIRILKSLLRESKSLTALAKELNIPPTTIARHVEILEKAKLVFMNFQPGPKGHSKHVALATRGFSVSFVRNKLIDEQPPLYSVELPIGVFSHCHIEKPCGMLSKEKQIAPFDTPGNFFIPERVEAENLWFDKGFISYNFPVPDIKNPQDVTEISFSFEICSETHCYNNNWPSDITIFINSVEVLTFTSPGDFGGRRGKYTPKFWPITSTQFGMLKTVTVNRTGIYLDSQLSDKRNIFDDLQLFKGYAVQLTIGIKDDAVHKGGINLFGKNFGDYPQGIKMLLSSTASSKNI